jgi:hypothetical protein
MRGFVSRVVASLIATQAVALAPAAIPWQDSLPSTPASSMVLFFTGDDCTLCMEAEEDVWSDPRIEAAAAAHTSLRIKNGSRPSRSWPSSTA